MDILKEMFSTANNTSSEPKNEDCCLKCKGKKNNTCSRRLAFEENNRNSIVNSMEPGVLIDHILREHHQYFYVEEPLISELLTDCMNHLAAQDYDLERLECLFGNLKNDLTAHFLVEETVLFPYIKNMGATGANGAVANPSGIENIAGAIQVMKVEHEAAEAILEEMEAVTDHYTPSLNAPDSFVGLYQKLKALHTNLEQHIYIENHILYAKALLKEEELMNQLLL